MGRNYSVQIDETIIFKETFIKSPFNAYYDMPGLTWMMRFIEEHMNRIYIEIVENQKSVTLAKLIEKHVYVGTLIVTDGYPSYLKAVKDSFCIHDIVEHSHGSKNKNGFTTDNIENLWSQLRYVEIKRKGVKKSSVDAFLEKFIFRYYYIKPGNFREIGAIWRDIIKFFTENK